MTLREPLGSFGPFPDWRVGYAVDRCCLKKVVCGAGLASYSGDAELRFASARRYLGRRCGVDEHDFLEATCAGSATPEGWQPRPYHVTDIQGPIAESAAKSARELEWYRERLPASRFYLVGYSLGGVLAFETAVHLLTHDLAGWRGRLAGVACLSAPLLGVDFGILDRLARGLAQRPDFYGRAGAELVERAGDPETIGQVEASAALLRASGVRLLFVADRHDAIVTPRDLIIPSARERKEVVTVEARLPADADETARRFGHGSVVEDSATLEALARLVGRQECLDPAVHPRAAESTESEPLDVTDAAVDAELEALKRQMKK